MCLLTSIIVTVLILECACVFLASSYATNEDALDTACSRFISSGTHNAVHRMFLLAYPKSYSVSQLTEFLLIHRLR